MKKTIYKLAMSIFVLIVTQTSLSASPNKAFEVNKQVNDALGILIDSMRQIQALNGDESLTKFGDIKNANPDIDGLTAMGESLKYPASLKSDFDQAAKQVLLGLDELMSSNRNATSKPQCQSQLELIEPQYQKVKASLVTEFQLNVAEPESRAKAYIAVLNAMPLSIIAAKISMLNMTACRMQ